jgi:xanthine dehydrogenase small subunit
VIQFLLNCQLRTEHDLDPNLTVLQYLREHLGQRGTKEGCGSGDCGACTVVLGELMSQPGASPALRYRSINACLTFVASLHGKQLITVEHLKKQGQLHSVQQAMVDCHGSQCGFCTPGFVMSLFALQKNCPGATTPAIHEALGGNLCRCTGYRPIVDAAIQACAQPAADSFEAQQPATIAQLQAIAAQPPGELAGSGGQCVIPTSVEALAAAFRADPQARLFAGGTDLALEVTQQHRPLRSMIYLGQIPALRQVQVQDDQLAFGAAAPLTDCYAALAADYPDFGALLHRFASLQVRNQGTLGGNIGNGSPIGDAPPLLLALGAQLLLRRGDTQRRLALDDFFLGYRTTALQPGEFIETVLVPRPAPGGWFRAYKVSKRLDDDISAVCAAFNLKVERGQVEQVRIAYGGMAATPKRALACEEALQGQPWSNATVEAACTALAEDFSPLSDLRASSQYRLLVAQNLLRKCLIETLTPDLPTRVAAHV